MGKITFVTGTDTGVGKTLVTACLVRRLRQKGVNALGMKPFCSGSRIDARLLRAVADNSLMLEEVNPFYYKKPLAPYAAAGQKTPSLRASLSAIMKIAARCDHLVIEGSGGVLVPLGKGYFVSDVIAALNCQVILVGRNQLGTINHTLLSVKALTTATPTIVLMAQKHPDLSSKTNAKIIREISPKIRVVEIPYQGPRVRVPDAERRLHRALDLICS